MNPKINAEKILDKVKLPNTFLALGFIGTLIAITIQYEIGLKVGIITLIFGGIFRILNILNSLFPKTHKNHITFKLVTINVLKFLLWFCFLVLYAIMINKYLKLI